MSSTSQDHIRLRAYHIWEQEGCPEGREDVHWAQAEAEVGATHSYSSNADDLERDSDIGYPRVSTDGDIEDADPKPPATNPLRGGQTNK